MKLPIFDEAFWKERYEANKDDEIHRAVYHCSFDQFSQIEDKHRHILSDLIKPTDSVLDAGCGYGRLLDLLPVDWKGEYLGVDLSPEFIIEAKRRYPKQAWSFFVGTIANMPGIPNKHFNWAITISIKQMVLSNMGEEAWKAISNELHRCAKRVLHLEYSLESNGEIEDI